MMGSAVAVVVMALMMVIMFGGMALGGWRLLRRRRVRELGSTSDAGDPRKRSD